MGPGLYARLCELGMPTLLHPTKTALLDNNDDLNRCVYELIEKHVEESVRKKVAAVAEEACVGTARVPPLIEMIAARAATNRESLAVAAIDVRVSAEARAFRETLRKLQSSLRESPRGGAIQLASVMADLSEATGTWIESGDPAASSRYKTRKLVLSKVPVLGQFLEAAGVGTFEIQDPVLFGGDRTYLSFVSKWYAPDGFDPL